VLEIAAASTGDHSAAFPVALPEWFIKAYTSERGTVYEPFGGSGTTLIAAQRVNRVALAMELSPKYCDVILRRYAAETGEEPVLIPHA
jgi:DNA modification methylase